MLETNRKPARSTVSCDTSAGESNGSGKPALPNAARTLAVEPPRRRRASGSRRDELLTLAAVEEKLREAERKNERLKMRNVHLALALADAAQRSTEARHLAYHDGLTGLPNRLSLLERLRKSIAEAFRRQRKLALLFIDLDRFKFVNDRLGHTTGDKLLAIVAARILAAIRVDDIACRYGGDEFVVVLPNVGDAAVVGGIAEELRGRIEGCYGIDGNEVHVSASIGFALYPAHGEQCDALLSHADASMYRSKAARAGRDVESNAYSSHDTTRMRAANIMLTNDACAVQLPLQASYAVPRPRRGAGKAG